VNKLPKIKLARLRGRNQITLPASVTEALSLEEGDYLAVVLSEDGAVRLRPAKMITAGTAESERAIGRAEADLAAGRSAKFDTAQDLTNELRAIHKEQMEDAEESSVNMLVHVGATSTSISVQRDGIPIFTRSIDLGIENASAQQLAAEVLKTVDFFRSTIEGPGVQTVFLSVGPPRMAGLADELKSVLSIPIQELSAAEDVVAAGGSLETIAGEAGFNQSINVERLSFPQKLTSSR
jgi:AbrB family looped-hinge helix DNA binding protein